MNILNTESPVPLYHQLADILILKIRSGVYPLDSRIPSENILAADYGIGRPTVRQAVDILVKKGLVCKKRGSGTFVRQVEDEVDIFSLAGTSSAFQARGITIDMPILHNISLKKIPLDEENPFAGSRAYFFSRLILAKNEPVLIEDIYLHEALFQGIENIELKGRSLAQVVSDRFYMKPVGGKQNFSICFLTEPRTEILGVSEKIPVLEVKRFLNFSQADNAVYSEIFCRTDRFVFSQKIGGSINGV